MMGIDNKRCLELAGAVAMVLDGLSVGQARWVLDTAIGFIESTHPVDAARFEQSGFFAANLWSGPWYSSLCEMIGRHLSE